MSPKAVPNRIIATTQPHSYKQRTVMNAFHWREVMEIWVACGTKWGKTLGASSAICAASGRREQALYRWIAPVYTQSKIGWKYCRRMLPANMIESNKSDLSVRFPHLDTDIQFFHGQNAESIEGEASAGNVLDEAAKLKADVYPAVKTTTTRTKGLIMGVSTPNGKNWFYDRCMEARDEMLLAKRQGRLPRMIFLTAPTINNPSIDPRIIAEAKRALPERLFKQYYLAQFIDDATVFIGFQDCLFGEPVFMDDGYQTWYAPDYETKTVVIGADWAKSQDRTVFTAIDVQSRKLVGFMRFYKTPYTEAIRRLCLFSRKFADTIVVLHDKTGIGDAIDDQLAYTELPYEGVVFTNKSKADMATKLMTSFEQQTLRVPRIDVLQREVDAYETKTTPSGLITFSAPTGKHDDIVSSLMLSNLGLIQYTDRNLEFKYLEDLKADKKLSEPSTVEEYYQSLAEEDD